jgi:hypothetical protein
VGLRDRARERALDGKHAELDRPLGDRLGDGGEAGEGKELRGGEEALAGCGAVGAVTARVADAEGFGELWFDESFFAHLSPYGSKGHPPEM